MLNSKDFLSLSLITLLMTLTLYPSIFLLLYEKTFHDFGLVIINLGKNSNNINLFTTPISYYFSAYGTLIASVAIIYNFFEFNSQYYYILALFLRVAAAYSIYFFVTKWSKNRIAGFISSLFFGISFAGIQNTLWVTLSSIYLEIIFIMFFLDKWLTFHYNPTKKSSLYSMAAFLLTILAYPARVSGLILTVFIVEFFLLASNAKNLLSYKTKLNHLLILLLIYCILVFGLKTLGKTPEIEYKMISPKILALSLLTGHPPIITTFWLFTSNIIISPCLIYSENLLTNNYCGNLTLHNLDQLAIKNIMNLVLILGIIFLILNLKKRRYFLALALLPVILFPIFIKNTAPFLIDWRPEWILSTQISGSIFLWCVFVVIFFIWNRDRRLAVTGILGILLAISYLIMPWMISTQHTVEDQSAFNFTHRYYTLPSVGMGFLLGSVFAFLIGLINNKIYSLMQQKLNPLILFKNLLVTGIFLILPMLIIFSTLSQSYLTNTYLSTQVNNIDAKKIDTLWTKIKPIFKDNHPDKPQFIYIEHPGNLNEEIIQYFFPARVAIYLGRMQNPPIIKFIFSQEELEEIDPDSLYAYYFDGINIYDIKNRIIDLSN